MTYWIAAGAVILAVEANGLVGNAKTQKPLTTVSGTIHFGLGLWLFGLEHFAHAFGPRLWIMMTLYAAVIVVIGQLAWYRSLARLPAAPGQPRLPDGRAARVGGRARGPREAAQTRAQSAAPRRAPRPPASARRQPV